MVSLLALLDMSSAFDTVDHVILLQRLSTEFGVNGPALLWVKSYLSDRSQSVKCGDKNSAPRTVCSGVPQGSVLGPLFFLIYTADLQRIINDEGLAGYFYADDSQIRHSDFPAHSVAMRAKMESCVAVIDACISQNRLILNPAKTELMWCGTSNQCKLVDKSVFVLGGANIPPVTTVKLLGVQLDSDLSMSSHVDNKIRSCFY